MQVDISNCDQGWARGAPPFPGSVQPEVGGCPYVRKLTCHFLDTRKEFFSVLEARLGSDFALLPVSPGDPDALTLCDVVIVGLRDAGSLELPASLELLARTTQSTAVPVVAFLPTPNQELMRAALRHGAFDFFVETASLEELRLTLCRAAQFYELSREVERLKVSTSGPSNSAAMAGHDWTLRDVFSAAPETVTADPTPATRERGPDRDAMARALRALVVAVCRAPALRTKLPGHESEKSPV